jgi:hypothetical protein
MKASVGSVHSTFPSRAAVLAKKWSPAGFPERSKSRPVVVRLVVMLIDRSS